MQTIEPTGYLRRILSPEEKVLVITRQHGFFLLGRMFLWGALAAVIVGTPAAIAASTGRTETMVLAIFALIPLLVVWWQYLEWSNHAYVLTDRRVIQMNGVLRKEIVDSLLEKLNDIKTEQSLLGRMFDYGDVSLLTANSEGDNVFRQIARPLTFKTTMLDAKQSLERATASGH